MASERSLTTPIAILIGSVIIALAVVFGPLLRPAPADRAPVVASVPVSQNPAPKSPEHPPAAALPSKEVVTAEATKALEKYRNEIIERCWKPAVAVQPDPPAVKLMWSFTFDATGQQAARGAREARGASRPDIRDCLDEIVKQVTISPPGAVVQVEVPLALP